MTAIASGDGARMRSADLAKLVANTAYVRLLILLLLFALAIAVIIVRLAGFALFSSGETSSRSAAFVPARADIVDRNGEPLARSIAGYAIWVRPDRLLGDPDELAAQLNGIFPDTSTAEFAQKLHGKRPVYLRRRALPREVAAVHALGEIAIEFPREAERLYPEGPVAAHLLGFVSQSGKGMMGVERAFDERLSDARTRGEPMRLALDLRVQGALRSELETAMAVTRAEGAAGVVLDVHTGEVVAMSTLPSFDPNKVRPSDVPHQVNDITNRVFELGSTFKPLTVAAALDAGTVRNLAVRYDATGPLQIGGYKIRDSHSQNRWLNVPEALVHSSNVVTARIADNLGQKPMEKMLERLGFNERPAIELGERALPIWPKSWGRITNMTVAYGHGIAVTPLHLASAYAALVNGGVWRPATLVRMNPDDAPRGRRVFSAATSARMRQLLRMIVSDGTGKKADAAGFRVGGKTGSAEKPYEGGYKRTSLVSTFAAAFPMDDPKYVVLVMLDEPAGSEATGFQRTAGWTAAPVVGSLVPRIGPMLGIFPDTGRDVDVSELTPLLWSPKGGG